MQSLEQHPAYGSCILRALLAPFAYFPLILHTKLRCHPFQEAFLDTIHLPDWVKDSSSEAPCV